LVLSLSAKHCARDLLTSKTPVRLILWLLSNIPAGKVPDKPVESATRRSKKKPSGTSFPEGFYKVNFD
jgi:hypothetical protein